MTPRTFLGVCPFRFTRFSPGLRWGPSQRLPSILQTSPLLTLPAGEAEKRISLTQSVANPGSNIPAQFPGTFPRKMESLGSPDCPEWGPCAGCLSRPQTLCGLLPEAPAVGRAAKPSHPPLAGRCPGSWGLEMSKAVALSSGSLRQGERDARADKGRRSSRHQSLGSKSIIRCQSFWAQCPRVSCASSPKEDLSLFVPLCSKCCNMHLWEEGPTPVRVLGIRHLSHIASYLGRGSKATKEILLPDQRASDFITVFRGVLLQVKVYLG